jgi:hypothetical protein
MECGQLGRQMASPQWSTGDALPSAQAPACAGQGSPICVLFRAFGTATEKGTREAGRPAESVKVRDGGEAVRAEALP